MLMCAALLDLIFSAEIHYEMQNRLLQVLLLSRFHFQLSRQYRGILRKNNAKESSSQNHLKKLEGNGRIAQGGVRRVVTYLYI